MAVLVSIAGSAPAQQITPKPLAPPTPKLLAPAAPLLQKADPGSESTKDAQDGGAAAGLKPVRMEVESLRAIDVDSVGTLSAENGGYGLEMWFGTSRAVVEKLLPTLPVQTSSRTMRALLRRLLLSTAKAPEIAKNEQNAAPRESGKSLIHLRIERLSAMGDVAAVDALLKVAPSFDKDQGLLRTKSDVLFFSNDYARVCPLVTAQIRQFDESYWKKAFIFCQILAGNMDRALLGATLLREQGEKDEVFFSLVDSLGGLGKANITSMANPRPLHFSMARAAKADLPPDVVSSNHPAVLRTVATTPGIAPELRIDAAERAEVMGALDTQILRDLYTSVTYTRAQRSPGGSAEDERNPLNRALLYRKALVEGVQTAKADVVSKALGIARKTGRFQSMARVYTNILRQIRPSRDLLWFAADAIRAMLAAGDLESAQPWLELVRSATGSDNNAALLRDELIPLARLTGAISDEDWLPNVLGAWQNAQRKKKDGNTITEEQLALRSTLVFNLIEALGDPVPDEYWVSLMDGPAQRTTVMPRPVFLRSITSAAQQQRIGETVLLALISLGQGGPTEADPIVLRVVIESLITVGLEDEARALAIEAAVAAGI
ncbi:MAG: hypothetical protein HQ503_16360 [Rhodospirillales bacterium]|nr:hypothetical protein [Rhodospirillales bacterium]